MLLLSEDIMIQELFNFRRLLLIPVVLLLAITSGAQESETDYEQRIVEVLEGYQELMSIRLDADVENLPGSTWYIVSQAINQGYLRFTVDPVTDSLLRGARFHAEPGQDVMHVIVTHNLLDIWVAYPSITYSVLTRSFRDAESFFRDPPAWGAARADSMEQLFMRLDQYTVESLLIRDRLLPSGFLLSPYEAFLLDSFEKDGLAGAILYLERFSLPVAQGIYDARLGFEENIGEEDLRDFVIELGGALLKNRSDIPSGTEDETVYPAAASVHTWLEFTPLLISRIHNMDRAENPLTFSEVLTLEPRYAEIRRLMEASRTKDMPLLNYVYEETVKGFEGR